MPKDLIQLIDDLFQGVVFAIFYYVASLWCLIAHPVAGSAILVRRQRNKTSGQVPPRVFLFVSLFAALVIPRLTIDMLNYVLDQRFTDIGDTKTPLQQAYADAIGSFEAQSLLAVTISCIVMSVAFEFLIVSSLAMILRKGTRRDLLKIALLYIVGFQAFLIMVAKIIDLLWTYFGSRYNVTYMRAYFADAIERSPFNALYIGVQSLKQAGATPLENGYVYWLILLATVCLYALAKPAVCLFRASLTHQNAVRWPKPQAQINAALSALYFTALAVVVYQSGYWIESQIHPGDSKLMAVSDVSCQKDQKLLNTIKGEAIVTNRTDRAQLIKSEDFVIGLTTNSNGKTYERGAVKAANVSQGNGSTLLLAENQSILLPENQSILVNITATLASFPNVEDWTRCAMAVRQGRVSLGRLAVP